MKEDSYWQSIEELREETKRQHHGLKEDLSVLIRDLLAQNSFPSDKLNQSETPVNRAPTPPIQISSSKDRERGILASEGEPLSSDRRKEPGGTSKIPIHRAIGSEENHSSWSNEFRGNRFPKIDFPVFDSSKPRSWIRKCEEFFAVFAIQEAQRIELAAMYVTRKADVWLQGFLMQKDRVSWDEFREAVCIRFGEKQGFEIVEELNKLEQKEDLEDYNEKFEELRACMLTFDPHLPESYFILSYVSGLKSEIKSLVKLGRLTSLAMVYEQARLHNETVQAIVKLSKPGWRSQNSHIPYRSGNFDGKNLFRNGNVITPTTATSIPMRSN